MKNTPAFLSSFCLTASTSKTAIEANNAYKPVVSASLAETATGKIKAPIPIERPASTMQLPIASPMAIPYCFLRTAVKSTASSGKDVPIETTKKLIKYSGMCAPAESATTELTTT